jgi:hypothetical protein
LMNSAKTTKNEPSPKLPNETVRTVVSLWLVFHLFGIALALATDTGMGRSQLLERMKRAPFLSQYLYALWLDVGYSYPLTAGEQDGDYSIETELVYTDGHHGDRASLALPDAHGQRLERYQALARRAAPGPDMETPDSTLPSYIGGAMLRKLQDEGVKEVLFYVRRHAPLSMSDAAAADPAQRNPLAPRTFTDLAVASVTLDSLGNPQVQFRPQSARDVAPVTNPRGAPGSRRPAQQPSNPPAADAERSGGVSPNGPANADKSLPELPPMLRSGAPQRSEIERSK